MRRPTADELDTANEMLVAVAREHGLANLRHGEQPGELVVDVDDRRDYFDVAFMDDVEGRVGFRPDVLSSGAPAACSGRSVGSAGTGVPHARPDR
jgi:hypothetical protein